MHLRKGIGPGLSVLLLLGLGGCDNESPVGPVIPPQVSLRRLATLVGGLPPRDSWSPVGRRLVYQSWNGSSYDLQVYDAEYPSTPLAVHSGDFSGRISWSPDGTWLLCQMQTQMDRDRFTGLYSLVGFPLIAGATPHILLARAEIDYGVWAANGNIYYWNWSTGERRSLDPPSEWSASNPGPFPDRPSIIFLTNLGAPILGSVRWFHVFPEPEETRFDYRNPGQLEDIRLVRDVFPNGRRFLASIPTYCGITAVVNERGKIITELWSHGCHEPPFSGTAVTSDGKFILGISEETVDDRPVSSVLYLADAAAAWRVRIENAPDGTSPRLSRAGYTVAYRPIHGDSIYVGDLELSYPR